MPHVTIGGEPVPDDVDRLRSSLPRPIGFVLGGGGSLGASQIGMLEALDEHGIHADLVVGTSIGAINGAIVAADPIGAAHRLSHIWHHLETRSILPGGWIRRAITLMRSRTSIYDTAAISRMVTDEIGDLLIEDLAIPYAAMAVDADTTEIVQLQTGPIVSAMLASSAIPGIFPPVSRDGRDLRDLPIAAETAPVLFIPGPQPIAISPLDFSSSAVLIASAYRSARDFLDQLTLNGPGLYRRPT
jgi:NTE family protein